MIIVEPTNVILAKMIGSHNDGLTFELSELPGMGEVTRGIVALFFLAGNISADLFWHDLRNNFRWVDRWVSEVERTQILPLLGSCINLDASLRLLLLLATGRVVIISRIGCGRVTLVSMTLVGSRIGIGTQCTT
jgi:hypothetical protein